MITKITESSFTIVEDGKVQFLPLTLEDVTLQSGFRDVFTENLQHLVSLIEGIGKLNVGYKRQEDIFVRIQLAGLSPVDSKLFTRISEGIKL